MFAFTSNSDPRDTLAVGDDFGDYRILELIEKTRHGSTCRVKHREHGSVFLLHVFPKLGEPESRQRVIDFVRVLQRHQNPGRLRLAEAETEAEQQHLLFGPIKGASLHDYVGDRGGKLSMSEAREVLSSIARVLQVAHKQGLAHGTLSPGKIYWSDDVGVEIFGLGFATLLQRFLDPVLPKQPLRSADAASELGEAIDFRLGGQERFTSPEVASGYQFNGRADQFSLGVLAYYFLTGDTDWRNGGPLSKRVPGASRGWDQWLATCTNFEPQRRYASIEHMLEALLAAPAASGRKSLVAPFVSATAAVLVLAAAWFVLSTHRDRPEIAPATPITVDVGIETEPAGADLSVNGTARGKSPQLLAAIPEGESLQVTATLPGYKESERHITAKQGMPVTRLTLEPLPTVVAPVESATRVGPASSEATLAVTLPGDVRMDFVRIDAGQLVLAKDTPRERVLAQPYDFYIQRTELSQRQFAAIMGGKAENPASAAWRFSPRSDATAAFAEYPVNWIRYTEVLLLLDELKAIVAEQHGGRFAIDLPAEGEWEYAARAGRADEQIEESDLGADLIVEMRAPGEVTRGDVNAFGLIGMLGNVSELCYPEGADRRIPATTLAIRGGYWNGPLSSAQPSHRMLVSAASAQMAQFERCGLRLVLRAKTAAP